LPCAQDVQDGWRWPPPGSGWACPADRPSPPNRMPTHQRRAPRMPTARSFCPNTRSISAPLPPESLARLKCAMWRSTRREYRTAPHAKPTRLTARRKIPSRNCRPRSRMPVRKHWPPTTRAISPPSTTPMSLSRTAW